MTLLLVRYKIRRMVIADVESARIQCRPFEIRKMTQKQHNIHWCKLLVNSQQLQFTLNFHWCELPLKLFIFLSNVGLNPTFFNSHFNVIFFISNHYGLTSILQMNINLFIFSTIPHLNLKKCFRGFQKIVHKQRYLWLDPLRSK